MWRYSRVSIIQWFAERLSCSATWGVVDSKYLEVTRKIPILIATEIKYCSAKYCLSILQDYVSAWQIRDALQQNRIIPTFVLQFDGRFGPPPQSLTQAYQSLRADLTAIGAQVLTIDSRNSTSATRDLISVIQTAYNVSRE